MKNENEKLEQFFKNFENQWDIQEIENLHSERFFKKLNFKKNNKKYCISYAVAASITLLISLTLFYSTNIKSNDLKFASQETKQTDSIFTVLIENELDKIKAKKSSENEKIVTDAIKQMKTFDNDYTKIIHELETNGENKQLLYAMLSNLQTRISFLQSVLKHIEDNEKLKLISDEKTI